MDPVTNYCEAILGENVNAKNAIRLIPELSNCSDGLLDLIYTYSKVVNISQGETLIEEGLYDQWVYFVVQGQLEIFLNDSKLGITPGPLVGERCIVGEPRGATLKAGDDGVMAIGIEMSLMDEINRDINAYSQSDVDDTLVHTFSNEKNKLGLELLAIILNEVILRILELSKTSLYILKHLTLSLKEEDKNHQHLIQANSLNQKLDEEAVIIELQHTDFVVFSKKLYDSIIHNNPAHENLSRIKESDWYSILTLDDDGSKVNLMEAFKFTAEHYQIPYAVLVEIALQMFEITSQYTSSLNGSLNAILALFDCERAKKRALRPDKIDQNSAAVIQSRIDILKRKIFDPIKEALTSKEPTSMEAVINKLSQNDIDSLFD